jgi:hypothetical protein
MPRRRLLAGPVAHGLRAPEPPPRPVSTYLITRTTHSARSVGYVRAHAYGVTGLCARTERQDARLRRGDRAGAAQHITELLHHVQTWCGPSGSDRT